MNHIDEPQIVEAAIRLATSDSQLRARLIEVQAIRKKPLLTAMDIERLAQLAGLQDYPGVS